MKDVSSRLSFLEKVDFLEGATIKASGDSLNISFAGPQEDYDAIVALLYTCSQKSVDLNISVVDAKTDRIQWHHKMSTEFDLGEGCFYRFQKHGHWTPIQIKSEFFGYDD